VHSHLRTDDQGVIIGAEYSGVDHYKTAIDEKFYVKNGKAYWKNKFENDSIAYNN
jgi:hypothetical protein